ncbi:MAG: SdrD B-like domain-containing protein, partial [Clostridia bacterium]
VGMLVLSSLEGYAWLDADGNGLRSAREAILPGVVVSLRHATDVVGETVTDANGYYAFTALRPGDYTLSAVLPSNMVFTNISTRTGGSIIAGVDRALAETAPFTLPMGVKLVEQNIGALQPGELHGKASTDGQPLSDVQITLLRREGDNWTQLNQTTTAADGSFHFTSVRPGELSLQYTLPHGWLFQTPLVDGTTTQTDSFSLQTGEMREDFSLTAIRPASLDVTVLIDSANDGTGKNGLADVQWTLLNDASVCVWAGQTDADGRITLPSLRPGAYTAHVLLPADYIFSANGLAQGENAADWSGTLVTDKQETLVLGALVPASLGGRVWEDENADGRDNGREAAVPQARAALYDAQEQRIAEIPCDAEG